MKEGREIEVGNYAKKGGVSSFMVQFTLPVDNPVYKVTKRRRKSCVVFEVPINYPDAHTLSFYELLAAAELAEKSTVFTPLNNTVDPLKEIQ